MSSREIPNFSIPDILETLERLRHLDRIRRIIELGDPGDDNGSLEQPSPLKVVPTVVRSGLCEPPIGE